MTKAIVGIVEGHGERQAVPILLRRLAQIRGEYDLRVLAPIRCPRSKMLPENDQVNEGELSRAIDLAVRKLHGVDRGAVLVLLDADDACPARIGPKIRVMADRLRSDVCVGVVLAKREYEAWFLAAMQSLRGQRGIGPHAQTPPSPESVSDAKGYLQRQMIAGRKYSEPLDQPALTAVFDFGQARACRSFRKMQAEVNRILDELRDDPS